MTQRRRRITRTTTLFIVGLLGILTQTVYSVAYHERPATELIIAFLTMMGLPPFLNRDLKDDNDRRRRDIGEDDNDTDRQGQHDQPR